jgi:predicted phosphodiesterase
VFKYGLNRKWIVTRREFLKISSSAIAGLTVSPLFAFGRKEGTGCRIKFGIVTDSHYADTITRYNRYYKESITKMKECVNLMNQVKADFLIELGDFKDKGNPTEKEKSLRYLKKIESVFQQFKGPQYHVLGNKDVDSISKQDFIRTIDNSIILKDRLFYSFDTKGIHFIVLDANFKNDGTDYNRGNFKYTDTNIPWLTTDLELTDKPVIVFVHQQLNCEGDLCVRNASEVRDVLQKSGKTLAVFQGHNHSGGYTRIEGVHYYTLKAMVDGSGEKNNSYATVEVFNDGSIIITGYRKAVSKELS